MQRPTGLPTTITVLLLLGSAGTSAFSPSPSVHLHPLTSTGHQTAFDNGIRHGSFHASRHDRHVRVPSSTFLSATSVPSTTSTNSPNVVSRIFSIFTAFWKALSRFTSQRILWPNSSPDNSVTAPLPPSAMGCPLFGHNILAGSKEHGPYVFFANTAKKLGNPSIFRYYAFGMPFVSVSGKDNIKSALKHEFDPDGINTMAVSSGFKLVFGDESILYQNDKTKHALLRRLAGQAMTPAAVRKAVPRMQATAEEVIDTYLIKASCDGSSVTMESIMDTFTMDIARKQILGLDIPEDELEAFRENTFHWINGMFNPLLMIPGLPNFLVKRTKGGRARDYLVSKVEERLDYLATLEESDGSSLGAMFFATDEDGKQLSREQLIDNALILILAGTETSSTTLTNASLLLGLHPEIYQRLRREQQTLQANYGDAMSLEMLDEECPYLDAVIRETMRIKPIDGMIERKTEETFVVDGVQVPQKYLVYSNIRQTHADDPKTRVEDGSHMDLHKGFKPDRWLNDETKPSDWMGFGEGKRRCLGERLALCEMKIFLASLARRVDGYDLGNTGTEGEILWKTDSVMARPSDGVEVVAVAAAE